jgi:hypothetical protein
MALACLSMHDAARLTVLGFGRMEQHLDRTRALRSIEMVLEGIEQCHQGASRLLTPETIDVLVAALDRAGGAEPVRMGDLVAPTGHELAAKLAQELLLLPLAVADTSDPRWSDPSSSMPTLVKETPPPERRKLIERLAARLKKTGRPDYAPLRARIRLEYTLAVAAWKADRKLGTNSKREPGAHTNPKRKRGGTQNETELTEESPTSSAAPLRYRATPCPACGGKRRVVATSRAAGTRKLRCEPCDRIWTEPIE